MEISYLIRWLLLAFLLAVSAFFSGSEVAFFSLSRMQLEQLKEAGGRAQARAAELLENSERLLVSIYIGNELVNVAISAVSTVIALEAFGDKGLAIAIGAGTFALLIFGEITPKTLAHYHNEKWATIAAYPLTFFMWIIYPVERVVTWLSRNLARIFGASSTSQAAVFSEEELKTIMVKGAHEGVLGEDEKEMIHGVFELGDITISDVMTPRADMLAIEAKMPLKEAWDKLVESPYARAPVYKENIDNITGVLFKKDLLRLPYPPPANVELESLVREPFIVPETMMINDLLRGFKKRKTHLAIAMDEYGGVEGVVTLDDVIAELVGETDPDNENEPRKISQDTFRLPASFTIEEFNKQFDTNIHHDEIETIGGYVFHLFGSAPEWGQSIETDGLIITVDGLKGSRITELKLKIANGRGNKKGKVD